MPVPGPLVFRAGQVSLAHLSKFSLDYGDFKFEPRLPNRSPIISAHNNELPYEAQPQKGLLC